MQSPPEPLASALREPGLSRNERARLLHQAASLGEVDIIRKLVTQLGVDVDAPGHHGWTPLHMAVEHHQREAVDALLSFGADINAGSSDGMTVLQLAVDEAVDRHHYAGVLDVSIVRHLLERGADPDRADHDGDTARVWALASGVRAFSELFF